MERAEPPLDGATEASLAAENQAGRVVIDFTVGPAGVGPVTSITPVDIEELLAEHPPTEQSDGGWSASG